MSTLSELIHYCQDKKPVGAMLLTGEWGSGKTWLITEALQKALADTHVIIRVSLFGMNSIGVLNETLHRQWLYKCSPMLSKMDERKKRLKEEGGLLDVLGSLLMDISPAAGGVASTVMSFDPIDYIPMEPEVKDLRSGQKKSVVLVFDDPDRTRLNLTDLLGCINDYCENQKFHTIIVTSEEFIKATAQEDVLGYSTAKEKVIAYRVRYTPDYAEVIRSVLAEQLWQSEDYAAFLTEQEGRILDVFAGGEEEPEESAELGKTHNLRSLIIALKQFYRIYSHLVENGTQNIGDYLASFLAYTLAVKSGVLKNGMLSYQVTEEEIARLYPQYSAETLPPTARKWIRYGYWDSNEFESELISSKMKVLKER